MSTTNIFSSFGKEKNTSTPSSSSSSVVLLSPKHNVKSPRSQYVSRISKKSALSTTCCYGFLFFSMVFIILHRFEIIPILFGKTTVYARKGPNFSLVENDYDRPAVLNSESFYWALVTADDLRVAFVNPMLKILVGFTAFLSALVAADRAFHLYVSFYWKYISKKDPLDVRFTRPKKHVPLNENIKLPGAVYYENIPNVCVQLPMFNECSCAEDIINAACRLKWPREHFMVQVLDDSTELEARQIAKSSVDKWLERGLNIEYICRDNRRGYKAGSMLDAMDSIKNYEYVAVFDADFDPDSDFLLNTVPWLMENLETGFVQTRWSFTNPKETLLTRVQEISLSYHMKCEQYARFAAGLFFNFNGTAGVWRRECIVDAGGWDFRTTVEDMDLSLRSYLRGWKFIFLNDVTCDNEIPAEYDAYRKQQHRWSCGPMQLWRKATKTILESNVPLAKKVYLIVFFFGARMFAAHIVSFFLYCLLVPLCAISPEIPIPFWALVYAPILVTISTVFFTKGGWKVSVAFILFENAMCVVKLHAMISGLFELSDAHEWVVTKKLGSSLSKAFGGEKKNTSMTTTTKTRKKIYYKELLMGVFFAFSGFYGIIQHGLVHYSTFLIAQGFVFCMFGLNKVTL
jgi:beta-mannan synthase